MALRGLKWPDKHHLVPLLPSSACWLGAPFDLGFKRLPGDCLSSVMGVYMPGSFSDSFLDEKQTGFFFSVKSPEAAPCWIRTSFSWHQNSPAAGQGYSDENTGFTSV